MHARYLKYYFIIIILLLLPAVHNLLFLKRIGELDNAKEVAAKQMAHPLCIYGSALSDNVLGNKLAMYELKKPDIIAIGSSRILQLREAYFKPAFYNMGFVISSVSSANSVIKLVMDIHKPKIMVMNVDFWWFHEEHRQPGSVDKIDASGERELELNYSVLPIEWLIKSKISAADFFALPYSMNKRECGIGAKGYERNAGYAPDGSYYYTDVLTGSPYIEKTGVKADYQFKDIRQRVEEGKRSFQYGTEFSRQHFDDFMETLNGLKAQGVEVVLFYPPLAPTTVELMKGKEYGYIDKLKAEFKKSGVVVYDYSDIGRFSSDCEFIDGFHAGDLAYAKVLADMAARDARVREVVDVKRLAEVAKAYNGLAMIPDSRVTSLPEKDFLGIGCVKNISGGAEKAVR